MPKSLYNTWYPVRSKELAPVLSQYLTNETHEIFFGFDTEYQGQLTIACSICIIYRNKIISVVYDWEHFKKKFQKFSDGSLIGALLHSADSETGIFKGRPLNKEDVQVSAHLSKADIFVLFQSEALQNIKQSLQPKERKISFWTSGKNKVRNNLFFLDTNLFNPYGVKSLYGLGRELGVPKVEISHKWLSKMVEFRKEEPIEFFRYSARDAIISAVGGVAVFRFLKHLNVQAKTAGSIASKYLQKNAPHIQKAVQMIRRDKQVFKGWDVDDLLGGPLKNAYYGGRAEARVYGKIKQHLYDVDLVGCYPTIASTLPFCEFKKEDSRAVSLNSRQSFIDHFHPSRGSPAGKRVGSYEISFSSGFNSEPFDIRLPALFQVRYVFDILKGRNAFHGVAPVLNGTTRATAVECQAWAYWMEKNSNFNIFKCEGVEYDLRNQEKLLFGDFFKELSLLRTEAKKEKNREKDLGYKLVMNSLTGKFGQGLAFKQSYNFDLNRNETIPPCPLTNLFLSSHITAYARVLLYQMEMHGIDMVQVNTDGFLTPDNLDKVLETLETRQDPFILEYIKASKMLRGETSPYLEVKHEAREVLIINRNSAHTVEEVEGKQPINQPGWSVKPQGSKNNTEAVLEVLKDPSVTQELGRISSLREMKKKNLKHPDGGTIEKKPNVWPDYKKRKFGLSEIVEKNEKKSVIFSDPFWDVEEARREVMFWERLKKAEEELGTKEATLFLKLLDEHASSTGGGSIFKPFLESIGMFSTVNARKMGKYKKLRKTYQEDFDKGKKIKAIFGENTTQYQLEFKTHGTISEVEIVPKPDLEGPPT